MASGAPYQAPKAWIRFSPDSGELSLDGSSFDVLGTPASLSTLRKHEDIPLGIQDCTLYMPTTPVRQAATGRTMTTQIMSHSMRTVEREIGDNTVRA